jgi:hypothetical protein
MKKSLILVILLGGIAVGAPPADTPFTFPSEPPAPTPPAPKPGTNPLLTGDYLYVINSKVDADVSAYPDGVVRITKETGPLRYRGKFIDGTGVVETKTFPGPFIFIVEAAGKGTVDLVVTPFGLKSKNEIIVKRIDVSDGTAPQPPPKPDPTPTPSDPLKSFSIIFVYESADKLLPEHRAVIYGAEVEKWMNANCTAGKNGYRRYDKNNPGDQDAVMKPLWASVQPAITVVPCVAMERNGKVEIVNLGATPTAMIDTFTKYRSK